MRPDGWLVHHGGPGNQGRAGTTGPGAIGPGTVLATAELACTRAERRRGLLGRDTIDGVLVLPARSVHTIGMRMPIDVAHLDAHGTVLRTTTMQPGRLGVVVWRARRVVEAPAGSWRRWQVRVGDVLEVRT